MKTTIVLRSLACLLPLACNAESDDDPGRDESLLEAPEFPPGTESILASEHVTQTTGVARYVLFQDEGSQRVVAFDADGNTIGESLAERRADGGLVVTYFSDGAIVTMEHDEPGLDADGNTIYQLAIDGQMVVLRDTGDGPVIEGELQLAHPEVLELWGVLDQDLVAHVSQWRTSSCTSCLVQATACTAASGACAAACLNPATSWAACIGCSAGVTTCWNGYYNNCENACVSSGNGNGNGSGGNSFVQGAGCWSSVDCPYSWQICLGGVCS